MGTPEPTTDRHDPAEADEEPPLLVERRGDLVLLSLNRPRRLNAVSLPLYRRLAGALVETDEDDSVRAVVLTGAGRAFSVGADLKAHGEAEPSMEERRGYVRTGQEVNRRLQRSRVPVIAAVNGHAVGAGLELALSADLIVVAAEAKLRFPEVALGTSVGGGVTYTLPARVGEAKARELLLLAPFFSGSEAAEMGIANRAVAADEVLPTALEMGRELAAMAPLSLRVVRSLLRGVADGVGREATLRAEEEALLGCMGTDDWHEGIRAFHEGRRPRFGGR